MVRVKRGKTARKRRKKLLEKAKGFRWGRKSKYATAKQALMKAWSYAYRDRKKKKGNFRRLWQIQIGNATKEQGLSYNKFIHLLKEKNIKLDRKVLAQIAKEEPEVFREILKEIQQ